MSIVLSSGYRKLRARKYFLIPFGIQQTNAWQFKAVNNLFKYEARIRIFFPAIEVVAVHGHL
jgi:hypothetical protein